MIDCPNGDVRDALPEYLNDRLDAVRRRDVESHLAGCEVCREELSLLRALRVTMRLGPTVDVDAIASAISPYRVPARRDWGPMGWRVAAAVVAIAVGGASIALLRERGPASGSEATRAVAVAPRPGAASTPDVVSPPSTELRTPDRAAPERTRGTTLAVRELAIAGGSIGDLSDGELSALVEGIESLDGLPSTEVESAAPVSISAPEGL